MVTQEWNNFQLIGQSMLRRFGFHVYDSTFWSTDRSNLKTASYKDIDDATHALSITYARKISAQQLLSSTKKEWIR